MLSFSVMSKLAALAKARSEAKKTEQSSNKSLDILNRLGGNNVSDKSNESLPISTSQNKENRIRRFPLDKKKTDNYSIPDNDNMEIDNDNDNSTYDKGKERIDQKSSDVLDTSNKNESSFNSLITNFTADNQLIKGDTFLSKFFSVKKPKENQKKRKLNKNNLFNLITNYEFSIENFSNMNKNFSEDSPDDKILNAQKSAFESGLKNLHIDEAPPKKDVFKNIDIKSELSKNKVFEKNNKSFVVIGHVDAGKSTLMGRLLLDLKIVDIKTVNKLVKQSESLGKGSFALAWIMDQTSEERSRGVTVDICATNFETDSTRFIAIDAPGHKDFVPQMISGVCQADFALLIIDSITGEFESGFQLDGQTKEHTLLAKNLGISNICCVINKLDKENWSQDRFEFIKSQLSDYLSNDIGFNESQMSFIPLSGLTGNNVIKKEPIADFEWYKGPTLIEYLESVQIPQQYDKVENLLHEQFNLVITDIVETSNQEFTVTGKIVGGVVQTGQLVKLVPINEQLKIQKLKIGDKPSSFALKGEIVELSFSKKQFKEKTFEDLVIGDIILSIDSAIQSVSTFVASINLFNLKKPLLLGTPFILFRNNYNLPATLTNIISVNGGKKKKHLVSNKSAEVEIKIKHDRLLPITKFSDNEFLGKIVLRREGVTIGAGTVINI